MITIYSKDNCNFCVKAKQLLRSKDIKYTEVKIGVDITRDQVVELFPGVKTVPIIVVGGVNIGGFNELLSYLKEDNSEEGNLLCG